MKFKIGDRVIVNGESGTIIDYDLAYGSSEVLFYRITFDDNLKNYEKIASYLDLSGGLETSGLKDKSKINIFLNNLNKLINETKKKNSSN